MSKLSYKQLLELIEAIASDDCAQDIQLYKPKNKLEYNMKIKLLQIYKIVHAFAGHCKNPHNDWKEEAVKTYKKLKKDNVI